MIARRILTVLIALLLQCSPLIAEPASDPSAIVSKLYEDSIRGTDAAFGLRKADRRLLSKSLNQAWAKADAAAKKRGDEIGPVGFDVVSMSQDPNIKSYAVSLEKRSEKTTTVSATFAIGDNNVKTDEKLIVHYDFVRAGNRWLIDDIRSSIDGKPYSLRENLRRQIK